MKSRFLCLVFAAVVASSCSKQTPEPTPEPAPPEEGKVVLDFNHTFGGQPLAFGTKYVNAKGDTVTVSKFSYYISNVAFVKQDGSEHAVPESYYIVSHSRPDSRHITVSVPAGAYKSVRFMLGVDSARNCSGAQTGGLDKVYASDMYWSWSSGYIFLKFEGTSPSVQSAGKGIEYHIGGYGGANKTQRTFSLSFGGAVMQVDNQATRTVHLRTEANELFRQPVTIDVAQYPTIVSAGLNAKMIADNYADMITFENIQ